MSCVPYPTAASVSNFGMLMLIKEHKRHRHENKHCLRTNQSSNRCHPVLGLDNLPPVGSKDVRRQGKKGSAGADRGGGYARRRHIELGNQMLAERILNVMARPRPPIGEALGQGREAVVRMGMEHLRLALVFVCPPRPVPAANPQQPIGQGGLSAAAVGEESI